MFLCIGKLGEKDDVEGTVINVILGYMEWDAEEIKTAIASLIPGRDST